MSLQARSGEDGPPGPPGDPPRTFQRLGRYRLMSRIGEGGMGEVYLALDPQGRAVAIKVLRDHVAYDADARARLAREMDTLSRVRHERVAAVIDADIHGQRPYLVTRYVAGPPLDVVVADRGPLWGSDLVRLGRGMVDAVEAIHAVGVVHRDIKPANVLMQDDVEPVLIDFGIAHAADDIRLTSTGLVMGTPGYLSPEVIEGAPVTPATDWWGWAATVTFAVTGRPPFGRGPMEAVLSRVRRGESDLAGVDARLEPLLAAALSPRPQDRPPVGTVLAALERYAASAPSGPVLRVVTGLGDDGAGPQAGSGPQARPGPQGGAGPQGGVGRQAGSGPTEVVHARHTAVMRQGDSAADPWRRSAWGEPPAAGAVEPMPQPVGGPERVDWGPAWAGDPGQPDPRIGRPDRSKTLLALVTALAAVAAVAPVVAVLVASAWGWAARVTDRSVTARVLRRHAHGRRRTDLPVAIALSPWHLVSAAVRTLVAMILPLLVGVATAFSVALAVTALTGGPAAPGTAAALAGGAVTAILIGWWGPGGASLRRGSRSIVRGVARPGLAGDVVVGLLVAVAAGCAVWALMRAGEPLWWPLRAAPDLLGRG